MTTTHGILPGTTVAVSRDGGEFQPKVVRRVLRFDAPVEATVAEMVFTNGNERVRVARSLVVVATSDGQHGE